MANPIQQRGAGVGCPRAAWVGMQKGRKATLYVIRCYGNGEVFYKVGISFCVASRFAAGKMPYRWRTLARYSSWDAGKVWDLEQLVHNSGLVSYAPLLPFAGKTECYGSADAVLLLLPDSTFILKSVMIDV
ncbi:hypothetical protein [Hymenobacter lapidiphilus]|uniref:GIY-YIG nuclease family protein n=1 Tax=Hymenobacter lapidiphilus TaxID=2608003 RepID=A0A7Y7U7Y4_9BACT|nr:hypothetical protein [Hymenobacter lapidiphilus]NVO33269.1 hypothetical protein [Hymenobacter lapidiphilus]